MLDYIDMVYNYQGLGGNCVKSLQVVTPYTKCMFNCPFCISKGQAHHNIFEDNYTNNHEIWRNNLINTISNDDELKYVVITGNNEPMQSKDCVRDIVNIVREFRNDIQIEIQTRYYPADEVYDLLDVVAYSISDPKLISKIKPRGKIKRYVIILTDDFNNYKLEDILNNMPKDVSQLTFKLLQDSEGVNPALDEYIRNHDIDQNTLDMLREDIKNYNGNISIMLDENCMDSIGRYKIFREDGNIYSTWDAAVPENK